MPRTYGACATQLMWQPAHDSATLATHARTRAHFSHYGDSATQSLARVHETKSASMGGVATWYTGHTGICSLAAHVHRSHRHSRPRCTRAIATPPREQSTLSDPHCISCARGAYNIRSNAMCRASGCGTVNGYADWRRPPMSRLAFVDTATLDGVNPLRALMGAHLRCGCF